jgi:hypothetical protein
VSAADYSSAADEPGPVQGNMDVQAVVLGKSFCLGTLEVRLFASRGFDSVVGCAMRPFLSRDLVSLVLDLGLLFGSLRSYLGMRRKNCACSGLAGTCCR